MTTWLKYIGRGLMLLTRRQFAPPSSERYSPETPPPPPPPPPPPAPPRPPAPPARPAAPVVSAPPGGVSAGAAPPRPPPGPSTVAYTVFAPFLKTSTAMRPSGPPGKPPPDSRVQVSPPSVDFQRPLPGPPPFMQHVVRRR